VRLIRKIGQKGEEFANNSVCQLGWSTAEGRGTHEGEKKEAKKNVGENQTSRKREKGTQIAPQGIGQKHFGGGGNVSTVTSKGTLK